MKKQILIVVWITLFVLVGCDQEEPEAIEDGFAALNYTEEDMDSLSERFSPEEINIILSKDIQQSELTPYLKHPFFKIKHYDRYEAVRTKDHVNHFIAVNYVHMHHTEKQPAILSDSNLILVNKHFYLNRSFQPEELTLMKDINLVIPGDIERNYIQEVAWHQLKQLYYASLQLDLRLFISNSYRSYDRQEAIHNQLLLEGVDNAMYSAKPGHSEHQTGLSVDFTCPTVNYQLYESFEDTNEGRFLRNNAHLYGFILRYPKDKSTITGYYYEPWHYRYVGEAAAKIIYEEQLTLEDYILQYVPLKAQVN